MKPKTEMLPKYQRANGRVEIGFVSKKTSNNLLYLFQLGCLKGMIPKKSTIASIDNKERKQINERVCSRNSRNRSTCFPCKD